MHGARIKEDDAERLSSIVHGYEERIVARINQEYERSTKKPDRLADKIASFGGSWKFIIIFATFLVAWMVWNTLAVTDAFHFDKSPFILLNLILSFTAAFQAPIIMMSQNRQAAREKQESLIDFAINWKAEHEIDDIQSHLHRGEASVELLIKLVKELQQEVLELKK